MANLPMDPSVDRAFARFARNGDPGALSEVFDRAAPELLRLASHFVSDLGMAEDLVQSTFLAAIEIRHDYDPRRPVLPWLAGILANRAREARKKAARAPDPTRVPPNNVPAPESAVADAEFNQAVSDAIAGMPEPYRPVLLMHLKLGHSVQEIALVLGRAPGTVRKQLSRGLEMLRKALPAGFAASISSTVLPGQGLAGLKEAVLGAAKLAVPAAATLAVPPIAIGGVILMKKTALVAVSVLGVAALAYVAWPDAPLVDVEPHSAGTAVAMQTGVPEITQLERTEQAERTEIYATSLPVAGAQSELSGASNRPNAVGPLDGSDFQQAEFLVTNLYNSLMKRLQRFEVNMDPADAEDLLQQAKLQQRAVRALTAIQALRAGDYYVELQDDGTATARLEDGDVITFGTKKDGKPSIVTVLMSYSVYPELAAMKHLTDQAQTARLAQIASDFNAKDYDWRVWAIGQRDALLAKPSLSRQEQRFLAGHFPPGLSVYTDRALVGLTPRNDWR